jgi:hypothetical protein
LAAKQIDRREPEQESTQHLASPSNAVCLGKCPSCGEGKNCSAPISNQSTACAESVAKRCTTTAPTTFLPIWRYFIVGHVVVAGFMATDTLAHSGELAASDDMDPDNGDPVAGASAADQRRRHRICNGLFVCTGFSGTEDEAMLEPAH